ncbi:hypothetical protein M3Y98_00148100 [Aphelenchoides besseyi]|nr:hypothetical protein M3Y98_00148100 [Aphelenchoides besseyi]
MEVNSTNFRSIVIVRVSEKLSTSQSSVDPLSGSASSLHLNHMASAVGAGTSSSATNPESSASPSATSGGDGGDTHATSAKDDSNNQLCAYHDCNSLAAGWGLGLGPAGTSFEGPTGASQAQSPSEEGDGKSNELLASCPAFRNELGTEPIRRIGLSRPSVSNAYPMSRPPDETTNRDSLETWQREHTAAEAGILEDVSNVYLGAHIDYFGTDDTLGPMAISMVRETSERKERSGIVSNTLYRLIIRISDVSVMRVAVPEEALPDVAPDKSSRSLMRELLELVCPQVHFGCLRPALPGQKVEDMLLKIDEQPIYTRYKVGVLYCRAGQSTEEQMYNNEHSSPALEEFLDFLGQRVRLRGFDAYKGGLDTKSDTTGHFHVKDILVSQNTTKYFSSFLIIGNDMVTVIFQEPGALPFSPITVRSHFQHVFIIVRVNSPCTDNVSYGVAVSRAKDVPAFGPPIRRGATYQKCAEFHDFLLTKIINAENAVHRSTKFAAMAARTRREALKDLAENHVMSHPNEGPSRIASRFLGGSVKRGKERQQPKPVLGPNVRGALSWLVDVHDHSFNRRISCVLGVSAENIVLLEMPLGTVVFATPTHSVLGWANTEVGLKMYYDHGEMLLMRCCTTEGTDRELNALLKRLEAVTNGEEAKEILLRRSKTTDSLGFHVQEEGVITDVEMYQTAWKAGLRQGSRIVEIEGCAVVALTHDQLTTLLDERMQLRLMMIAPSSDGNPRRGCEDPHCPAIKGQEVQILTPETFAKAPLTYHEMFKIRNKELSTSPHNSPSGSFEERHFNFTAKAQDQRKEQVGSPDAVSVQEQQRLLKKTSTTSSTSPNFKPVTSLSHQHSDADTREIIQAIEEFKFDAELPIQFEDEISRYRWHLQRLYKEKKETEKQAEFLRSQLSTVSTNTIARSKSLCSRKKRSHENTRKQLELLQRYCARLSQNQPEGDEVL